MPFRGAEQHFEDMIHAVDLIQSFLGDLTLAEYETDPKTRAAVERQLQIVSEATYRLTPDDETLCVGPDWKQWRGLGNMLRHAYHRIDDELIWDVVKVDIPKLRAAVTRALGAHFPSASRD